MNPTVCDQEKPNISNTSFGLDFANMPEQNQKTMASCLATQRQTSPSQASPNQKKSSIPKQQDNNTLLNSSKLSNKNTRASSCLIRRSSETTQIRTEDKNSINKQTNDDRRFSLKNQKNTKELGSSGSKTSRHTPYGIDKEDKMILSMRDNNETKNRKSLTISSVQDDFSRIERSSIKRKRENNKSIATKTLPNDENINTSSVDFMGIIYKEKRLRTNVNKEKLRKTQNKSISFQSSSGNLFQDIEASFAVANEDISIKEEVSIVNKEEDSIWKKEISLKEIDIKNIEKDWSCFGNTMNPVTSPSFGTQATENHLKKMFENKSKGKMITKGNSDKKDNEHNNVIGKLYGGGGLMKKKKWTPLLSKKT